MIQGHICARYLTKLVMDLDRVWFTVETCLSNESHSLLISSDQYSWERIMISSRKTVMLASPPTFTDQFLSSECGMMTKANKLHVLMPVGFSLNLIQGHSCMRYKKNCALIFSQISQSVWMQFKMLSHPLGLLKPMFSVICVINIQQRELSLCDCSWSIWCPYGSMISLYWVMLVGLAWQTL